MREVGEDSPKSERPNSRSEATRTRILTAAAELVTTTGPDSASIEMIAQVAGIARQTVYNYYPRRAQLLIDMARAEGIRLVEQITARIDFDQPAGEILVRSQLALMVAAQNNPVLRLLVTNEPLSSNGVDADLHQESVRQLLHRFWAPIVERIGEGGVLRQDVHRTVTYLCFVHFVLIARSTGESEREVVRRLFDTYVLPALLRSPSAGAGSSSATSSRREAPARRR